jgi:inner membrane protein
MDPLTHVATGVALSQFVPSPSRTGAALTGLCFAILPDLDYVLIFQDRLSYLKHHRGFTHSLVALVLFVFLGAGLARLVSGPRWVRPVFLIGSLVLASHLFLDWTTSYGTQLLNPFTRAKFSLDWMFIIDPYFTALVAAGAVAALWSLGWGRTVGAICLGLAGTYILMCGFYHHQAVNLARQVFQPHSSGNATVAALPQPFSPRRWLLMAASPGEMRQAFVQLPYWPVVEAVPALTEIPVRHNPRTPPQAPQSDYRPPEALEIHVWQEAPGQAGNLPQDARRLLNTYLEFSRFPILIHNAHNDSGIVLTWLDLRFSVPGRAIPFVFDLHLDQGGRLSAWHIGGARLPFRKSSAPSPRPG